MIEERTHPRVGYIVRSYPRLSQTFVLNEILALEQLGVRLEIFAGTDPREPIVQPQVAAVRAPVHYLDVARRRRLLVLIEHVLVMLAAPWRYLRTLRYVHMHPEFDAAYHASSRYDCLMQAIYLTRLLRQGQRRGGQPITHLHAHFAHDPTLIALLVHMLTGIPFSFTAHARDLLQIAEPALLDRIAAADTVITCCGANLEYLESVTPPADRSKLRLIHHGVNLQGFRPVAFTDGSPARPLILSVGRLVEKKGFADLLRACRRLKEAGHDFECLIYGDGPLRDELNAMIRQLELVDMVRLAGACPQHELVPLFQRAAVFALTPYVTEDGDRDGVPNVLVEAMACAVPVVSTAVAGIPELVTHEYNGLLAQPHDVDALAASLASLLADERRRRELGAAARRTVVEQFDERVAAGTLAVLFRSALRGEPCLQYQ